jgi:hypothetical protein
MIMHVCMRDMRKTVRLVRLGRAEGHGFEQKETKNQIKIK